jgi:transcriptional regulator with XRE-family HTH domain
VDNEAGGAPWEQAFIETMVRTRRGRSWSQTELAQRLSAGGGLPFHQQTIQRIESGSRPLRLNEAVVIARVLDLGDLETAITPPTPEGARSLMATSLKLSEDEYDRVTRRLDEIHVLATEAAERLGSEAERFRRQVSERRQDANLYLDAVNLVQRWETLARAVTVREPSDEANIVMCTECGEQPAELDEGLDGQLCVHCRMLAIQNQMREMARKEGFDLDEDVGRDMPGVWP